MVDKKKKGKKEKKKAFGEKRTNLFFFKTFLIKEKQ
jgi:hypothetical protein